jgi:hypothetical protein
MLIICDDESDARSPLEIQRDPAHVNWLEFLDRQGITLLDGVRLRPTGDATSVRSRRGETLVSDGPFVETKEQIAGFALIECDHLDDAIEAAARHPFAEHGVIEVRPAWDE